MSAATSFLSLRYTPERQRAFCELAADYNPMHDDPVFARRTLAGGQVVHGIHHVLAAMEALPAHLPSGSPQGVAGFTAQFLKPVLVGDTLSFHLVSLTEKEARVAGIIDGETMCTLLFQLGKNLAPGQDRLDPIPRGAAQNLTFADLPGMRGDIALGLDETLARKLFPHLVQDIGTGCLAEMLSLSRLVGMHCPGLHSLFSQAKVDWTGHGSPGVLAFAVEQTDERFNRIILAVEGPRLRGQLTAFYRPPPEPQPRLRDVAKVVKPGEFSNRTALIIGGSRGLGEITAKIIVAGGGRAIVTYHQGVADAEALAREIREGDGLCNILQLDIRDPDAALRTLAQGGPITSLYYFATPKIFGSRRGFFSRETLAGFFSYYVTAFQQIVEHPALRRGPLQVFYPSSVAVDENSREMAEYAIAKRAGEDVCAFYNQYGRGVKIVVERLPRIKTDQTSTLLPYPAEESIDVMLPIVRRMENGAAANPAK